MDLSNRMREEKPGETGQRMLEEGGSERLEQEPRETELCSLSFGENT